jgi:hypothetical protein
VLADSDDSENEGGLGNVSRVVMRPAGHSGKAKRGHLCFDASFETGKTLFLSLFLRRTSAAESINIVKLGVTFASAVAAFKFSFGVNSLTRPRAPSPFNAITHGELITARRAPDEL